jgi:hypothetical protein
MGKKYIMIFDAWRISERHRWELQPLEYPEDKDGDGPQNVGFVVIQPLDAAGSPRKFHYTLSPRKLQIMQFTENCS